MIVFIAGMPRSGSTFSFNIVRRLLEERGSLSQEPTESVLAGLKNASGADHLLLKGHGADEITLGLTKLGAIRAICTVRKPEDAIASWMATFGFTLEQSLDAMNAWLQMFSVIRSHALIVPFEEIDQEPTFAALKIAHHLWDDFDQLAVEVIASEFTKAKVKELSEQINPGDCDIEDLGFSFYDKKTFFHRRHVSAMETTMAPDRIGREKVLRIREALKTWCDGEGNLL